MEPQHQAKSAIDFANAGEPDECNGRDHHDSLTLQIASSKIESWFASQGWKTFEFQRRAWKEYLSGGSGLIHAPTGTGKTYAVAVPPLLEWLSEFPNEKEWMKEAPLRVLWITPLRALANDTVHSILAPIRDLGLPWTVQSRTGDTSASIRAKQRNRFPSVLITTPESLSLLLTYAETRAKLGSLRSVVVDEWHELLGTKRGVQTELCLARLRRWKPDLRVWGLSATLGNLEEALAVLVGQTGQRGRLISDDLKKGVEVESLVPVEVQSFPWAGHTGLDLLPEVVRETSSRELIILGNFFHAPSGQQPEMLDAVAHWRAQAAELRVTLIRGNHDRASGRPPEDWRFTEAGDCWSCPPFTFCHEPRAVPDGYVMAGHIHPAVVLRERFGVRFRAAAFCFGKQCAILPAFGSFTGMASVKRGPRDRFFAISPEGKEIVEVGERLS